MTPLKHAGLANCSGDERNLQQHKGTKRDDWNVLRMSRDKYCPKSEDTSTQVINNNRNHHTHFL